MFPWACPSVQVSAVQPQAPTNSAHFAYIVCIAAAGGQERGQAAQRAALLQEIGLPTHHYLRRSQPLPAGLLAAAALCMMPDALAYDMLAAPAEQERSQPAVPSSDCSMFEQGARQPSKRAFGGHAVEVPGSSGLPAALPTDQAVPKLPLPPASQLAVLASLVGQLESKVAVIPGGSAAEDRRLSGQLASTSAASMALRYRAGQKEIADLGLQVRLSCPVRRRGLCVSSVSPTSPSPQALRAEVGELLHSASVAAESAGLCLGSSIGSWSGGQAQLFGISCILPAPSTDDTSSAPAQSLLGELQFGSFPFICVVLYDEGGCWQIGNWG